MSARKQQSRWDPAQAREATSLIVGICDALEERAEKEAEFRLAIDARYKDVYRKSPPPNLTRDTFYSRLFRIDRHVIEESHERSGRATSRHVANIREQLDLLGCRSAYTFDDQDFATYFAYLTDIHAKIADFTLTTIPEKNDAGGQPKAVAESIKSLDSYGYAAIIGPADRCKGPLAAVITATGGTLFRHSAKDFQRPAQARASWIDLLIRLIGEATETTDAATLAKLNQATKLFLTQLTDWPSLNSSEKKFVRYVKSGQDAHRWSEFCELVKQHASAFREPGFIADVAALVQLTVVNSLVVIEAAQGFAAESSIVNALFGTPNKESHGRAKLRLLVSSQNPNIFSFLGELTKDCTHLLDADSQSDETAAIIDEHLTLRDPRDEAKASLLFGGAPDFSRNLIAKFTRDDFQERNSDIQFIKRFLNHADKNGQPVPFQWTLVTGPAGEGKTRFALKCLDIAKGRDQGFRGVGFLLNQDAKHFADRVNNWRPQQQTFIVIDYPAEVPDAVATILHMLSEQARFFAHPVRLLLLEREAAGKWFEDVVPPALTVRGETVRRYCFHEDERHLDYRLTPMSAVGLLAIMQGRLPPDHGLSDEQLRETLTRIDSHVRDDGEGGWVSASRPLFAAATAEAIANIVTEGRSDIAAVISKLQVEEVFFRIIERWRAYYWTDHKALSSQMENRQLHTHANLLAIATIALELPWEKFDAECPQVTREKYLPDHKSFEEDRYQRMAGGEPRTMLKRLEPDILGEFFVLDRLLNSVSLVERQALINAGLSLGGDNAAVFLIRCAMDIPDLWRALDFLKPTIPGPAIIAFAHAATELPYFLDKDRFNDVMAVMSHVEELAARYGDPELYQLMAEALLNNGVTLGELNRHEEALEVYAEIVREFGDDEAPALREQVAKALFNKGITLGELNRREEELEVYAEIVRRFGDDEALAKALLNKADTLVALNRAEEAHAVLDEIIRRFESASEPLLRDVVRRAISARHRSIFLNKRCPCGSGIPYKQCHGTSPE